MERMKVESSNIKSIWYDKDNHILEVEFKNEIIYHYFNVPESKYNWLMNAESVWRYINQYIKWTYDNRQTS